MTTTQNPGANPPELRWDRVYGDPENTGKKLISTQGQNANFLGTCGIVACANVLRLAGRTDITENEVLNLAKDNKWCEIKYEYLSPMWSNKQKRPFAIENGGTDAVQREKLLRSFNIESFQATQQSDDYGDPDRIADCIAEYIIRGHGIIASVYSGRLWENTNSFNEPHAVTVIGVKMDASSGKPLGFYVCDSGRSMKAQDAIGNEVVSYEMDQARYYDWSFFRDALTGKPMNVTKYPIRLKGRNPQ